MKNTSSPARQEGFAALPRTLLDALLCADLTKRELLLVLLVARLTYGVRGSRWAELRQRDLAVVGIGANHAKACLTTLLTRGLLLQHTAQPHYRLNLPALQENATRSIPRDDLLRGLVKRQLKGVLSAKPVLPETGTGTFLTREKLASQRGKGTSGRQWRFRRSHSGFVQLANTADRQKIDT